MKTKLFISKKIKVGFNLRPDTYNGKLGYVIGHDGKKWRKEPSWEGWRQKFQDGPSFEEEKRKQYDERLANLKRNNYTEEQIAQYLPSYEKFQPYFGKFINDKSIEPVEYDNIPTEGFVLNKKVGGNTGGWNPRATYTRVYDPRGFEFEISIPNLLFILQECNAMKGKGLEGEFVYSWEGKDLVLLPIHCEEFRASSNFTEVQAGKVGVKDLVEGCTYKDKQLEDFVYLGKFNWFDDYSNILTVKKSYIFYDLKRKKIVNFPALTSFSAKITDVVATNYAELMDLFNQSKNSGLLNNVTLEEFVPPATMNGYGSNDFPNSLFLEIKPNTYEVYTIRGNRGGSVDSSRYSSNYYVKNYDLKSNRVITIKDDGDFMLKSITPKVLDEISKSDLLKKNFKKIKIVKNNKNLELHL